MSSMTFHPTDFDAAVIHDHGVTWLSVDYALDVADGHPAEPAGALVLLARDASVAETAKESLDRRAPQIVHWITARLNVTAEHVTVELD